MREVLEVEDSTFWEDGTSRLVRWWILTIVLLGVHAVRIATVDQDDLLCANSVNPYMETLLMARVLIYETRNAGFKDVTYCYGTDIRTPQTPYKPAQMFFRAARLYIVEVSALALDQSHSTPKLL